MPVLGKVQSLPAWVPASPEAGVTSWHCNTQHRQSAQTRRKNPPSTVVMTFLGLRRLWEQAVGGRNALEEPATQ